MIEIMKLNSKILEYTWMGIHIFIYWYYISYYNTLITTQDIEVAWIQFRWLTLRLETVFLSGKCRHRSQAEIALNTHCTIYSSVTWKVTFLFPKPALSWVKKKQYHPLQREHFIVWIQLNELTQRCMVHSRCSKNGSYSS